MKIVNEKKQQRDNKYETRFKKIKIVKSEKKQ